MFQVFLMFALFGSIFTVGKVAVIAAQPYFLTSIRMLLAGGFVLSYLAFKKPQSLFVPRHLWKLLILVAFFNVFITNAFEFWGLQYMNAGKTSLIYNLAPFIAALMGYVFGTEQMTLKKCVGLVVGTLALVPMMLESSAEDVNGNLGTLELFAEGALLISAITSVIGWTFVKKMTNDHGVPGAVVNGYSFLLAGIMCMIPSLLFEEWAPVPVTVWPDFLWTLAYIVIIHNLICYSIFANSLKRFSVTFMTFAGLSNALFAGFFGWILLDEPITFAFIIAFVGITIGLTLFSFDEQSQSISV